MDSGLDKLSVERKQSDLDSGLALEDRTSSGDLRSQLLLLQAQNACLIGRVEELQTANRRLVEELENKSRVVSTGNLMISTLTLMLREREASLEALKERSGSMAAVMGGADTWSLGVLRRLLEDGWDEEEPAARLRQLVALLEEALAGMDRTLAGEAQWKAEAQREMHRLHLEVGSLTSANSDLRYRVEWYEEKIKTLEKNLRNRLRNYGHLKTRLTELEERNEDLQCQIREKRNRKNKYNSESRRDSPKSSTCDNFTSMKPGSCGLCPPVGSGIEQVDVGEYTKIKIRLMEEENINKDLKAQLDILTEEHQVIKGQKEELEIKAKNVSLLRRNFIKLVIRHKRSVEVANENIAKLNETISRLKNFLKMFGLDFVERAMMSKRSLEAALGVTADLTSTLSCSEISETLPSDESESHFQVRQELKFEEVPLEEIVSGETLEEEVVSTISFNSSGREGKSPKDMEGYAEVPRTLIGQ